MSEREATRRLLRALQSQLPGLIAVNIQTSDGGQPRQGQAAKPLTFFNWFSSKARVHLGFLTAADRLAAISRTDPLAVFDASTKEESTVAIRVSILAPARTEPAFQTLSAQARAKKFQHLHVTKWHRYSFRDAQHLFGFAAQDIGGMEECFRRRFIELVPDLPPGSVELVRSSRDAWAAEGKNGGMRVYTTSAGQLRIREGLHDSKHPDTGAFWSLSLPSNPPGSLEFKWTTGAVWAPDSSSLVQLQWAQQPALAVTASSAAYNSVEEAAEDLETSLLACERICLPAEGQSVRQQTAAHPQGYRTLRQALSSDLPSGVTWQEVVDLLLTRCPDIVRNADGDTNLLESITATPLRPQASPRSDLGRRSRSPAPVPEGSNARSRSESGGGGGE
mgnify:CR=1 FL=1